jgi:L-amino acid N-acyltransferase YncA
MTADLVIRRAQPEDYPRIWTILEEVIQRGDTFAYDPATTPEQGFAIWMETPVATYVAERGGAIVGSYVIRPAAPREAAVLDGPCASTPLVRHARWASSPCSSIWW